MEAIKMLIALLLVVLFFLPIFILTLSNKLRYKMPKNKKNVIFLCFSVAFIIVFAVIASLFNTIADFLVSIPFIGNLISKAANNTSANFDFVSFVIIALFVNLVTLYGFIFVKLLFYKSMKKKGKKHKCPYCGNETDKEIDGTDENKSENDDLSDPKDDKTKKDENDLKDVKKENEDEEDENESNGKLKNVPSFLKLLIQDKKDKKNKKREIKKNEFGEEIEEEIGSDDGNFLTAMFFKGPDYVHVKPWVFKSIKVIKIFIILFELLYLLIFTILIFALLYPMGDGMYKFLIDILHINKWYIYPFLSLIFLQELYNIFDTTIPLKVEDVKVKIKEEEDEELDGYYALQYEIKKRFDYEHHLRYYPTSVNKEIPEYQITNVPFRSALEFIKNYMNYVSGHVVESYVESLDAMFNGNHVYFCASFYSEFGEYLITYAYTRLLAGERLIFVTSDPDKREHIKKYIKERLNKLTHTTQDCTWRVYTCDERVDQADVLIATPSDFENDSIAINYPVFFEEVSNAIFIDVDKAIINDSYICPIMALRLLKATDNRVKFIFLTDNVYRGISASSLPKFFCIDKVAGFSGARENEKVDYVLWNRESKSSRIYNKYNQFLSTPESILAELGVEYKIDGVRVITDSPLEHGDVASLTEHNAEINDFYKNIPNINFMVYNDNRNNLSAAIYFCTRFRGKKKSNVHIISKPYLLREYFASRMNYEDFINRSSFIQPRVTEHVNNQKLSLLRIFCAATIDTGMPIEEFEKNIRGVITLALKRGDNFLCEYCKKLLTGQIKDNDYDKVNFEDDNTVDEIIDLNELSTKELASYLIAGLCDNIDAPVEESYGYKAKNYFVILDKNINDGYTTGKQKNIIFNRSSEVFEIVLRANERVSLFLNDKKIGVLNTFPARVKSEFVIGQRIVYNNVEYEIEQISSDYKTIFLKRENVNYKNVLDTIFLRRYNVDLKDRIGEAGVLYNTTTNLEKIMVEMYHADVTGETYGFYNLLSDKQSIDFIKGAQGNPLLDKNIIENHTRNIKNGKVLMATLKARIKCNDKMRLLLAALFNEFIKTMFPDAYRSIAVVPILEEPFDFPEDSIATEFEEHVKRIYPYLKKKKMDKEVVENPNDVIQDETDDEVEKTEEFDLAELRETDKKTLRFLFINDCENEDLGVIDWFYDSISLFMEEVLVNIYSYCSWLKPRTSQQHYIYFGNSTLPESFDLDGCCELLHGLNKLLSESGIKDYETAPEFDDELGIARCSFCHHIVESGRYYTFDAFSGDTRIICANCFDIVDSVPKLFDLISEVYEYLTKNYEYEKFNGFNYSKEDKEKQGNILYSPENLPSDNELSENYYRLDVLQRKLQVELNLPVTNAKIAILRSLIALWQIDNNLGLTESIGQLYYEEIVYLCSIGDQEAATWVLENLSEEVKQIVIEINDYISGANSSKTSFDYMRDIAKAIDDLEDDEEDDDEGTEGLDDFGTDTDELYDPLELPRFWKRYLNGNVDITENEEDTDDDNGNIDDDNDNSDNTDDTNLDDDLSNEDEEVAVNSMNPILYEYKDYKINSPRPDDESLEEDLTDDDFEEDDIPENLHIHTEEIIPGIDATCTESGLTEGKRCSECGEILVPQEVIPALGHSYKKGKCTICGEEKEKKESLWKKWFGKKKKKDDENKDDSDANKDDSSDLDDNDNNDFDSEKNKKNKKDKSNKKDKNKDKDKNKGKTLGEKICPIVEEEKNNPKIRLYNTIVRQAYNLDQTPINYLGVSKEEMFKIWNFVRCDYPELFWLDNNYLYTDSEITIKFRCLKPDGKTVDKAQINRKRRELEKGAKKFVAGINKKTDPYKTFLMIYRRLITYIDYDGIGLDNNYDDKKQDDTLRSLHSALVTGKVVCAGYAVALQYLLHMVGIPCAYVISEVEKNTCHAFNIVKIGKRCYYVDATWGDTSNTKYGDNNNNVILYKYCCVPYREFIMVNKADLHNHIPNRKYYPFDIKYKATKYEYHRYHKYFLTRCNEKQIIDIFVNTAKRYNPKEMGDFAVSIRCVNSELASTVYDYIWNKNYHGIIAAAKEILESEKDKKAATLLDELKWGYSPTDTTVMRFVSDNLSGKKKKQNKSKK